MLLEEVYGQAEVTFENEYVKGIDVKELIFSPTPVQPTVIRCIPTITKWCSS
jgi:hypothetical protein